MNLMIFDKKDDDNDDDDIDNDIDTQKQRLHNLMKKYDWQSLSWTMMTFIVKLFSSSNNYKHW